MVTITRLKPSETIDVDCSVVSALFRLHGSAIAEDILMGYVADLTDHIGQLDTAFMKVGYVQDANTMRNLSGLASEIGLTSLARTLIAMGNALDAGNIAALPALWDRVKRIGDSSLIRLWDLPQLRM